MPPPCVERKIENIIFYYYAKLVIAPSAGFKKNYGFIINAYKKLVSGEILISDYERELLHMNENQNSCSFCGSKDCKLDTVHIVPRYYGIPPGIHNLVYACSKCAISKGEKDLVEWWCKELGKPRDDIPRVPIGIYLKIAYDLNKINFSLKKP
ncbi:MAG: HNH endonuclease [Candidatus Aminicenantes bacterium]|nr:HNH endonuclease [Candidatus Aminicenantes bacterium]